MPIYQAYPLDANIQAWTEYQEGLGNFNEPILTAYYQRYADQSWQHQLTALWQYTFNGINNYAMIDQTIAMFTGDVVSIEVKAVQDFSVSRVLVYSDTASTYGRVFVSHTTGYLGATNYDNLTLDGVPITSGTMQIPDDGEFHVVTITATVATVNLAVVGGSPVGTVLYDNTLRNLSVTRANPTTAHPHLAWDIADGWHNNPVLVEKLVPSRQQYEFNGINNYATMDQTVTLFAGDVISLDILFPVLNSETAIIFYSDTPGSYGRVFASNTGTLGFTNYTNATLDGETLTTLTTATPVDGALHTLTFEATADSNNIYLLCATNSGTTSFIQATVRNFSVTRANPTVAHPHLAWDMADGPGGVFAEKLVGDGSWDMTLFNEATENWTEFNYNMTAFNFAVENWTEVEDV